MKKIFTFLMAMMIVMASFAQESRNLSKIYNYEKSLKERPTLLKKEFRANNQEKTSASFWYDYGYALANFYSVSQLDWDWYPMSGDTTVYYSFTSGASTAPYTSVGRAFDWSNQWWNNFYYTSAGQIDVPALWATDSYTIDSVGITFVYEHGDEVPVDRVDTLVITYILNLDNQAYRNVSSYDSTTLQTNYFGAFFTWLPVDPATSIPALYNTMGDTLDQAAVIYTQKELLTIQDTSGYFLERCYATPAELQNISCDKLAVFYTFKPAKQNQNTILGTTCNFFGWFNWVEPRDEYNTGGELPYNDLNWDYKVDMRYSLNSASAYYGVALPEILYSPTDPTVAVEHDIQAIALHATCNNCAIVNVEEMDKNNVTIYPNPATTEITVNNNNNERTLVEMFNLVGQKVYSEQFVNSTKINVSNMKAGVYMLKVNNHTTKVVVR